jgi:PAS domain S-box-containing protein
MDLHFISDFLRNLNATYVTLVAISGFMVVFYNKIKPYTTITDDISKIKAELTSNSGKSLKDLVKKIEVDVESNTNLTKTIMCRQRWILDNRNEPIFEVDEKGNFTWVNEAFIRLTKRSCNDLLNNKWKNIIIESQRDIVFEHWNNAIKEKRNFEETIQITNKKGEKFSLMCIASIQEDGKYIGCLTDIKQIN